MSIIWETTPRREQTITMAVPDAFRRGDFIRMDGFVNSKLNGKVFKVSRARGFSYVVEPAGWVDYARHYANRLFQWARWHWHGFANWVEGLWQKGE